MTALRLYTERKPNLASLAAEVFEAFTVIDATGAWKGTLEASAIIEVMAGEGLDKARATMRELADKIKAANKQEAVMLTETPVSMSLV